MVKIKKELPVTSGSIWWGGGGTKFIVTDLIEDERGIWVHYEDIKNKEKKFNCLIESFTHRFSECLS